MKIDEWIKKRLANGKLPSKEVVLDVISTKSLLGAVTDLSKALKKDALQELGQWHNEDLGEFVDEASHHKESKLPEGFQEMATNPDTLHSFITERQMDFDKGISPKLITEKTPQGMFMIRPYHGDDKRTGELPSNLPFTGFNIMAAKNIYDKSGLSHLIEDVGSVRARPDLGIDYPVTIHRFESDEKYGKAAHYLRGDVGFTAKYKTHKDAEDPVGNPKGINPLQAKQMAAMDWLLGNSDRHPHNWLIAKNINNEGNRDIKAFDHDRVFDYDSSSSRSFSEALETNGPSAKLGDHYDKPHGSDKKFKDWWNQNKSKLYEETNRQISMIKDDGMRRNVRTNFNNRYEGIDNWAEKTGPNSSVIDATAMVALYHYRKIPEEDMSKLLEQLPSDPHEGMSALIGQIPAEDPLDSLSKFNEKQFKKSSAAEVASAILQNAQPAHASSLLSKLNDTNTDHHEIKNMILDDLMGDPSTHSEHLQDIVDSAEKNERLISPYRLKRIKTLLRENNDT